MVLLLVRSSDDVDERPRLVSRRLLLALDEIAACSSVIVLSSIEEGAPFMMMRVLQCYDEFDSNLFKSHGGKLSHDGCKLQLKKIPRVG